MFKLFKRKSTNTQKTVKRDGWENIFTGINRQQDTATKSKYGRSPKIDRKELTDLFTSDGLARRIVEMPAQECTRRWLKIAGEEGEKVLDEMEILKTRKYITEAFTWARLYGGAVILRLLDDGQDLDQPLNLNTLRKVVGYRVYDKERVNINDIDYNTDQTSINFMTPEYYTITPRNGGYLRVHRSRVSVINGDLLPDTNMLTNNGWHNPVLQKAYNSLKNLQCAYSYTNAIVKDFITSIFAVSGLRDALAADQEKHIIKRLEMLDLSKSILNSQIIDAEGETFTKQSSSVAGLPELIDKFKENLSADSGIPITKLFGQSPGGMNATGDSDLRNYYDFLQSLQHDTLSPVLEHLIRDIYASKEGPTKGKEPEQWSIVWEPLEQPTEFEVINMRKVVADTDAIYIDRGVISADEVALSRFGQGQYSYETILTTPDNLNANPSDNPKSAAGLEES